MVTNNNNVMSYLAFIFLLFGTKLWLIFTYGNPTPFWDQWDSEAWSLYKPFIEGNLTVMDLFAPHNEHRIFTTRILALALFKINGIWSPLLQMIINAIIHIATLTYFIIKLRTIVSVSFLSIILVFSLIIFAFPYAYGNTLAGFQTQFYLVLLFSASHIQFSISNNPLSIKWWIGLLFGILAFFSLASGIIAFATTLAVEVVFAVMGLRRSVKQVIASLILFSLIIAGVFITPGIVGHNPLKAHSFMQFFEAVIRINSWPASRIIGLIIRNLPVILFLILFLKTKPQVNDKKWFLVAMVIWSIGSSFSISYGRATGSTSSRYLDLFAIMLLINFVCLLYLASEYKNKIIGMLTIIWTVVIFISLSSCTNYTGRLNEKHQNSIEQQKNSYNFLLSGDESHLRNKAWLHIPYPSPDRLIKILSSPTVKSILPSAINDNKKGRLDGLVTNLLNHYYHWFTLGMIIIFSIMLHNRFNKT